MQRKRNQSLVERMRAKEWRALPQDVALRGDTRSAKRRRVRDVIRTLSFSLLFCGIVALFAYIWSGMVNDVSEESGKTPVVGVEFIDRDGVLGEDWFRAWTGFDETRQPNLNVLRARLLEYPQVLDADIRRLPGKIQVFVRERVPVARMADERGNVSLVAADGVIFPSKTFPQSACDMLPLLKHAKISVIEGSGFARVDGIAALTEFLTTARENYPKLFGDWGSISLKDFPTDSHDAAMPWCALRVFPKPLASNPAAPQIQEIIFSADPKTFHEDLRLLGSATNSGKIDEVLSAPRPGAKRNYRMLFITNRKDPEKEFREMRLIPVPAETE